MDDKFPSTIEACHELIKELLARFAKLEAEIAVLKRENTELKEKLNNNSSNSSLAPSKSRKKPENKRKSSGKNRGGQEGHKGHHRELLPPEKVDNIVHCGLPKQCDCGGSIQLKSDVVRHQVYELPVLNLNVTEYRLSKGCCAQCKQNLVASLPEGMTYGITGPRLTSFMSQLTSKYGLSRPEQRDFMAEHFGFQVSLGTIFNKQKLVTEALEAPHASLLNQVKQSDAIHMDETGHQQDKKPMWLWTMASSLVVYMDIFASRGKKVIESLLAQYHGTTVSDRYAAYNVIDSEKRQFCWAHLKRDFTKISEKADKIVSRIGKQLLDNQAKLFQYWHDFKDGRINRYELINHAQPIRRRIGELLEQGSYTDPLLRIANTCKNLLKHFNALWTFLETEGVEPTNNHAERCLRHSVIWRKKYYCTRSDYGTKFVARSATLNMTCRLQNKSSFQCLVNIMANFFNGKHITFVEAIASA